MKIRVLLLMMAMTFLGMNAMAQVVETEEITEEEVFSIVEEMPSYPGGAAAVANYIANNLQYPQSAIENGIQGKVFVQFVVEKDGSVSNVKVIRGLSTECDEAAVNVVKSMPKWTPGKQRNQPVRVSYSLPIMFRLQ